jgi:signal transduction histidine kinase
MELHGGFIEAESSPGKGLPLPVFFRKKKGMMKTK